MHWKPLVIASCFAVTMIGCAVDTDDDRAPNVTIRNEQPSADKPDVHIGVEHKGTDVDINANSDSRPAPDKKDVDIDINTKPAP